MTTFRTCKNCIREKDACEHRAALKSALAGLGVTSVKHACGAREPLFSVGQRVTVTWPVPSEDGEWEREMTEESWPATVIKESGPRFLIKVDDTPSDYETPAKDYIKNPSLFARTTARRLSPLNEPPQVVCGTCQRPGEGAFAEGGCYGQIAKPGFDGWSGHRPHGCLALADLPAPAPKGEGGAG